MRTDPLTAAVYAKAFNNPSALAVGCLDFFGVTDPTPSARAFALAVGRFLAANRGPDEK